MGGGRGGGEERGVDGWIVEASKNSRIPGRLMKDSWRIL